MTLDRAMEIATAVLDQQHATEAARPEVDQRIRDMFNRNRSDSAIGASIRRPASYVRYRRSEMGLSRRATSSPTIPDPARPTTPELSGTH